MASPLPLPQVVVQHAVTLYRQGMGLEPLSDRLGTNWRTLRRALENAGVPIRPQGKQPPVIPPQLVRSAAKAYRDGAGLNRLARQFNVQPRPLRAALVKAGVKIRPRGWMTGRPAVHRQDVALVPYEDRLAAGMAAEAKREAARIARCRRRCEQCSGVIAPHVRHQCRA